MVIVAHVDIYETALGAYGKSADNFIRGVGTVKCMCDARNCSSHVVC